MTMGSHSITFSAGTGQWHYLLQMAGEGDAIGFSFFRFNRLSRSHTLLPGAAGYHLIMSMQLGQPLYRRQDFTRHALDILMITQVHSSTNVDYPPAGTIFYHCHIHTISPADIIACTHLISSWFASSHYEISAARHQHFLHFSH